MRGIVSNARCVLFDFDGPVCHLFAARPAESVARRLRDHIEAIGASQLLTDELRATPDPQVVLLGVAAQRPGAAVVRRVEAALTSEEIAAAGTARPTPHAAALIAALTARGRQVAVATNNSPLAVEHYLTRHSLAGYFGGRIHGRTHDTSLLKPHPDTLLRALASTRTPPEHAVMIGDSPTDCLAARAADVAFLGYAPTPAAAARLKDAGAPLVVRSLDEILTALITATRG
ncbi:HAD family hydrolase [Streptomyces sp. 7-21]|jgi:HAD superfamily hydrolase (TIGR01509 family)|uniref:HAD family hydrolase n=1 Tax=Streptomyces sp. 7-21 TaxID=2802283 RepID=UPI00191E7FEB|nr:HAD family hydrolase [Streptomyces sp. 7-21]MBL1068534.1 HAD family hydrolase [Streptomyces sp. 7-21]